MTSRFAGAGYLLVDNRASDWGGKIESDVLVCRKCEALLHRHDTVDYRGRVYVGWANEGAWVPSLRQAAVRVPAAPSRARPSAAARKSAFPRPSKISTAASRTPRSSGSDQIERGGSIRPVTMTGRV